MSLNFVFLFLFVQVSFSVTKNIIRNATPTFRTTFVRLRDGVHLAFDYFIDEQNKSYPVILELTPYGRGPQSINYRYEAPYWFNHGYVFAIADCRGTGDSEGEMEFLSHEGEDGYDLIEWIAQQTWSNGRVGLRGSSYTGTNQWHIAREEPTHLSCITPSAAAGRPMQDIPYRDGAFALGWAINWINNTLNMVDCSTDEPHSDPSTWLKHRPLRTLDFYATGKTLPLYQTFLDHPTYDEYWRKIEFMPNDFARIKVPSLAFTGWFDGTMHGTIWRFQGTQNFAPASTDQFLIVGPYTHENAPDGGYDYLTGQPMKVVGDLPVPVNAILPGLDMTREFFNWCLQDGPRPNWSPVQIYITGSNRWMKRDRFPSQQIYERSLYLTSKGHANSINGNGRLQWNLPINASKDFYRYDPNDPIRSDALAKPISLPIDINEYLNREDILVYTTEALAKPITVIGDVIVELLVSSTTKDTDFVVEIMDVMTDGRSIKLGSKSAGQLRLRYRNGFDHEIFLRPNRTYVVRINLHEIGHTFLENHRIRLAVMSSFYPWINTNSNTGNPIDSDIQLPIIADQTIHHGPDYLSRIRMPVIDEPNFDD